MTDTEEVQATPVVKVARDLSAIIDLYAEADPVTKVAGYLTRIIAMYDDLLAQAVADATSHLMPGGRAMVELGPVTNLERWENMTSAGERLGRAYTSAEDEDPDESWSAFQRIEFWSEEWRRVLEAEYDGQRPTIATEANFVRHSLNWAWDHEPAWADFETDIHRSMTQLEDILSEGKRSQRGVKCFDCNVDLIRPARDPRKVHYCQGTEDGVCIWPHRFCPHDRGGLTDEWHCPSCDRRYDREDYLRAVQHAHFVYADYLTLVDAASRTNVKAGTIKVWAHRGKVRRYRDHNAGRMTYCVADIQAADTLEDPDDGIVA